MNSNVLEQLKGAKATVVGDSPLHKRITLGIVAAAILASAAAAPFLSSTGQPEATHEQAAAQVLSVDYKGSTVDFEMSTMQQRMANGDVRAISTLHVTTPEQAQAARSLPRVMTSDHPLFEETKLFVHAMKQSLQDYNQRVDEDDDVLLRHAGTAVYNAPGEQSFCFTFSHNQLENPIINTTTPDGYKVPAERFEEVSQISSFHFASAQQEKSFTERHEIGHCGLRTSDMLDRFHDGSNYSYTTFINELAADIYALASLPDRGEYIDSVVNMRLDPNSASTHVTGPVLQHIQKNMDSIDWPGAGADELALQDFTVNLMENLKSQDAIPSQTYYELAQKRGDELMLSGRSPMVANMAITHAMLDFDGNLDAYRQKHEEMGTTELAQNSTVKFGR